MNPLVDDMEWLGALLRMLLRVSLVMAVALAGWLVLRRSHPAWGRAVCRAGLAGVMAAVALPMVVSPLYILVCESAPPPAEVTEISSTPAIVYPESTIRTMEPVVMNVPVVLDAPVMRESPAQAGDSSKAWSRPSLDVTLLMGVVLVYLAFVVRHGLSIVSIRRLLRGSHPISSASARRVESLMAGVRVAVRTHPAIPVPCVAGLIRPVILLPGSLPEDDDELRAIIEHELAHVRSLDLWWKHAHELLCVAFWFHPLVWVLARAHDVSCEEAADAAAARRMPDAAEYGPMLADLALRFGNTRCASSLALPVVRRARIASRLRRLEVTVRLAMPSAGRRIVYTGLVVLAGGIAGITGLVRAQQEAGAMDLVAAQPAVAGAPALRITPAEVDFGVVDEGELVYMDFAATNTSDHEVHIVKFNPGCSCTVVEGDLPRLIKPGEKATLRATYDTKGRRGKANRTMRLETSDASHPVYELKYTGIVRSHLYWSSKSLFFSDFKPGVSVERELSLITDLGDQFKIERLEVSDPRITASIVDTRPHVEDGIEGMEFVIRVAVPAYYPDGDFQASLTAITIPPSEKLDAVRIIGRTPRASSARADSVASSIDASASANDGELQTLTFVLAPSDAKAPHDESTIQRAKAILEIVKTLLYSLDGIEAAKAEGRNHWFDENSLQLTITDYPVRSAAVVAYLQSIDILPLDPPAPPAGASSGVAPGMTGMAQAKVVRHSLRTNEEWQEGKISLRLVSVWENDPEDENDDTVEFVLRWPDSTHDLMIKEFREAIVRDLVIAAEDIKPSKTPGEGRARLRMTIPNPNADPNARPTVFDREDISLRPVEEFFRMIGNPPAGYDASAPLIALKIKGASDPIIRQEILRCATAIISNHGEAGFRRSQSIEILSPESWGGMRIKEGVPVIAEALRTDPDETVRGRAALALGRFNEGETAAEVIGHLEKAKESEQSEDVLNMIDRAIRGEFRPRMFEGEAGPLSPVPNPNAGQAGDPGATSTLQSIDILPLDPPAPPAPPPAPPAQPSRPDNPGGSSAMNRMDQAKVIRAKLWTGEESEERNISMRLVSVQENNPDDRYDDSVEVVVNTPNSSSKLTIEEFRQEFVDDLVIAAEDIQPSRTAGVGQARLRLTIPNPKEDRRADPGWFNQHEIDLRSVPEFFQMIGNPPPGYHDLAPVYALVEKGKSDPVIRQEILRYAAAIIADHGETPIRRLRAIDVLNKAHINEGIPVIGSALKSDPDATVRACAAQVLGEYTNETKRDAIASLKNARESEKNEEVLNWINRALAGEFERYDPGM